MLQYRYSIDTASFLVQRLHLHTYIYISDFRECNRQIEHHVETFDNNIPHLRITGHRIADPITAAPAAAAAAIQAAVVTSIVTIPRTPLVCKSAKRAASRWL